MLDLDPDSMNPDPKHCRIGTLILLQQLQIFDKMRHYEPKDPVPKLIGSVTLGEGYQINQCLIKHIKNGENLLHII
jgi:hypothetical protein